MNGFFKLILGMNNPKNAKAANKPHGLPWQETHV
jgi:hypothetical protein